MLALKMNKINKKKHVNYYFSKNNWVLLSVIYLNVRFIFVEDKIENRNVSQFLLGKGSAKILSNLDLWLNMIFLSMYGVSIFHTLVE